MSSDLNRLLVALYKARQRTLQQIEEDDGPPSEIVIQNELSVGLDTASDFIDADEDELENYVALIPELARNDWVIPDPESRDNQDDYSSVYFTPLGIREAKRLLG